MLNTPHAPPLDGSVRILPGLVDFHVTYNPQHPWAVFPSPSPTGAISVSFKEFADATHRIAHAVRPLPNPPNGNGVSSNREVVAVLVHCDTVLYCPLLAGMIRAGLVPFPMSPRNSAVAVVNMLEKTSCHRVVANHAVMPLISAVKAELSKNQVPYTLDVVELPDLYDIFPVLRSKICGEDIGEISDVTPYPDVVSGYTLDEPIMYLHSSGSTGFPKPIRQTHTTMLEWCQNDLLSKIRDWHCTAGAMALPTFHTMGIYQQLYSPLVTGQPVALYAPQARPVGYEDHQASPVVPSPQITLDTSRRVGCHALLLVPSFLEVWAQSEEDVQYLASMKFIVCTLPTLCYGGPLSDRNGNKLVAAGAKLHAVYGTTEFGAPSLVVRAGERIPLRTDDLGFSPEDHSGHVVSKVSATAPDVMSSEDWAWMPLSPRIKPRWEPQGDGTYELHVLTCETHHPSIENLPDVKGYATSDLWKPHPTKKGLWKITGRKDDVIVLGSGEKVVPIQQEGHIASNFMVSGAVMFGRGRNQCGVLIEPRSTYALEDPSDEVALAEFRNTIWSIIEEANRIAPTFARIFKEMIIVTDTKRPLPRAAKGTVVRQQALGLYEKEIEMLYQAIDEGVESKGIPPPETWDAKSVESWLAQYAVTINGGVTVQPTIDVFNQGFDSLHATFMRNKIIGSLRNASDAEVQGAAKQIGQNFVFEHPTLRELATAVCRLVNASKGEDGDRSTDGNAETAGLITALLSKYATGLPVNEPSAKGQDKPADEIVVLLTGSTGAVGSHLLAALLEEPRVRTVYALNRVSAQHAGPLDRQLATFEERKLPVELLSKDKYVPLYGDLGSDAFGLEQTVYEEVASRTTHVIHNAWKVDFNQSLRSFEPLIASTRRLIDACYTFACPVTLLFSSSEAVSLGWDRASGPVPEEPLGNPNMASPTGYGASKYITENLLLKAANSRLRTVSLRIGQVCGAKTTGAWNTHEWVPILVKSSLVLGALPDLDELVTWIPMDTVASVFVDLTTNSGELPSLLNVVNPDAVPWRTVLENINSCLNPSLPFISSTEWLARLEGKSVNPLAADLERVPAIKLLEFFRRVFEDGKDREARAPEDAKFSTHNLVTYSSTARDMGPIDKAHAKSWVEYWKRLDFL